MFTLLQKVEDFVISVSLPDHLSKNLAKICALAFVNLVVLCDLVRILKAVLYFRPSKKMFVCENPGGQKTSTRQAGNPFFSLILRLYIQAKFSKEQKK